MKGCKKIIKFLGLVLLAIVLFIVFYILVAFILSRIEVKAEPETSNDVVVFIITNGVHTDIAVPVNNSQINWSLEIIFENTTRKDTSMKYLALGWGEREFYLETPTWADLKFTTAFKAAFGLSTTAVHATFYRYLKDGRDCERLNLSRNEYSKLICFLRNSFKKDRNGHFINIKTKANYGENDAFYEAQGRYNLFFTCNTWTNSGLKVCGQKACLWTPFQSGIFYHYREN